MYFLENELKVPCTSTEIAPCHNFHGGAWCFGKYLFLFIKRLAKQYKTKESTRNGFEPFPPFLCNL